MITIIFTVFVLAGLSFAQIKSFLKETPAKSEPTEENFKAEQESEKSHPETQSPTPTSTGTPKITTQTNNPTPAPTEIIETTIQTSPKPRATIPTNALTSTPTPTNTTASSCPKTSNKYATVIKLSDSLGNVFKQSAYNECSPSGGYYSVKKGETLKITVESNNTQANPVLYEFVGNGFPNSWQSENNVTITVDDKYETLHLRVFIKNSDESYRAPDYDDLIQVFYTVTE